MDGLQIRAIIAGIVFGAWPLFMNKSGLNGIVSTGSLALIIFIITACFIAFGNTETQIADANWTMVIIAGVLITIGFLVFNGIIAEVPPKELGTLFVLMILVQILIPAIYSVLTGELSIMKVLGFILAGISAFILIRY